MKRSLAAAAVATVATAAPTATKLVGSKVGNFMLADQTGMGHELYYYKNFDAVVVVSSAQGDKVSDKAEAAVAKLQAQYKGKRVHFMMLDSGAKSDFTKFEGRPGSADASGIRPSTIEPRSIEVTAPLRITSGGMCPALSTRTRPECSVSSRYASDAKRDGNPSR